VIHLPVCGWRARVRPHERPAGVGPERLDGRRRHE
jgi:hypothetical protein